MPLALKALVLKPCTVTGPPAFAPKPMNVIAPGGTATLTFASNFNALSNSSIRITSIPSDTFLLPSGIAPLGAPASDCLRIILAAILIDDKPGLLNMPQAKINGGMTDNAGLAFSKTLLMAFAMDSIVIISWFFLECKILENQKINKIRLDVIV